MEEKRKNALEVEEEAPKAIEESAEPQSRQAVAFCAHSAYVHACAWEADKKSSGFS
jgi:hypothetical protein